MILKWLKIPAGETHIQAVQLWEVRWPARYSDRMFGTAPAIEVFTSADAAKRFAEALREAFKLTKNTVDCSVDVRKAK